MSKYPWTKDLTNFTTQTMSNSTSRAGLLPTDPVELCRQKLNSYQHVIARELGRENVMDKDERSIETFEGSDTWRSFFDSILRFISEKAHRNQGMKFYTIDCATDRFSVSRTTWPTLHNGELDTFYTFVICRHMYGQVQKISHSTRDSSWCNRGSIHWRTRHADDAQDISFCGDC